MADRAGCVSDTHGNMICANRALNAFGPVSLVLHAGDNYRDRRAFESADVEVVAVTGNCDYWVQGPSERLVEIGGVRVLLTHGHQHGVKLGLNRLVARARALRASVVVFGHTHMPVVKEVGGVLLVNPGSPTHPRGKLGPTCAVLEVDGGRAEARILELGPGEPGD